MKRAKVSHYLQDNWKLFRWTALFTSIWQPHLESGQLLGKERTVFKCRVVFDDSRQLSQTVIECQIPGLPVDNSVPSNSNRSFHNNNRQWSSARSQACLLTTVCLPSNSNHSFHNNNIVLPVVKITVNPISISLSQVIICAMTLWQQGHQTQLCILVQTMHYEASVRITTAWQWEYI